MAVEKKRKAEQSSIRDKKAACSIARRGKGDGLSYHLHRVELPPGKRGRKKKTF